MTYDKDSIVFEPFPSDTKFIDLTNKVIHRLTVLGYAGSNSRQEGQWWCECVCGTIKKLPGGDLRRTDGRQRRSCGCLRREIARRIGQRQTTHGMSNSPEFSSWAAMKSRCNNPNDSSYARYGGRGITICKEWNSFANFYADMGDRPSLQHTLDRFPNNDGNYEPSNCRWGTGEQQGNNKRTTKWLTFNGKTQSLTMWARELHIKTVTLQTRIDRLQWSVEKALMTPVSHTRYGKLLSSHRDSNVSFQSSVFLWDNTRE